ncbi:DICT sensory domain-containing protein [Umezakia ovalisporum]|jgi:DICT domain-containing protein|uniref:Metal-dependent phosphohydrolase n=2 Tax=Umezakia ovalisporum TaxID=75695 RepID=A0AA43KF86_9CYAN|nr:DICT sensory domain-containing protein [Umezakia ovalisporum]MBI1240070.1 metal-dependent phosphohydrolase [Nostoc sp. RI_552]MDH6056982.1 metal-dependent phosphohydrolase [Umezakia ovalisporum FSS-43]MDH6064452.1 metal-dependent phosphohydrolase [Umezakia ovalisporum FSS-62]MDH6068432.1 metal-dependent phosphohydrolase [Umezakia ovalisporum APH033B]MDH6071173.1 metal-dependent phosphohydrolase [Umezakia ovalisporum CobakiLakeA]
MLAGSILQQLEAAHRNSTRPIRFGVYYKNTLVSLCHALEDYILSQDSQPLVITAFQQGKWYLQEAERYADIAKCSREIVIMAAADTGFAEHPTSQLPNVDLVALNATDPVAQEWHLMILSPQYTAMVLCQELSEADYGIGGIPDSDLERKFYGLWTFEPDLVQETAKLAIAHIATYNPELAQKLISYQNGIQPSLATPENLSAVVSLVVDYLQTGQNHLSIPTAPVQQALDHNLVSNEVQAFLRMAQLMDMADIHNPMAAAEVVVLCETMGQLLELPAWQIKRLRLAAHLHRIYPLQKAESVLTVGTSNRYQEQAPSCPLTCPLVPGAQVLRTMPRLRAVAQIITHQTEWWNGTGEPAGLAGDEIPLESRILGLIADFQYRINHIKSSLRTPAQIFAQALDECRQQQSTRFDPKLLDALALLVMGLQQGLDLPLMSPKVSTGLWLLDSQWDSYKQSNTKQPQV